jgi:hypothetical protein
LQQKALAQCSCSGNTAPSSVSYLEKITTTNAGSTTISFPQFNPSIGTLGCVLFQDTISGVTNTTIQNSGSNANEFQFLLTVANGMTGPGVSLTETFTQNFGPDSLAPNASITYGPDSLFTNVKDSSYAGDTAGYQGSGSVNYTYSLNGGLTALSGGLNYNSQIITNYWGSFRLIYYYCQANNNHCMHFTATKGNGCVNLQWQSSYETNGVNYQIQCGKNENAYNSCGQLESSVDSTTQDTASYQYKYNLTSADQNTIYFRIKRTDAQGNVSYSPIRWIDLNAQGIAGCNVYPNPAHVSTTVEFEQMLTGKYLVELLNGTGTCVQKSEVSLFSSNQISLNVGNLTKGLYFLHIKDESSSQEVVTKVLVQ